MRRGGWLSLRTVPIAKAPNKELDLTAHDLNLKDAIGADYETALYARATLRRHIRKGGKVRGEETAKNDD